VEAEAWPVRLLGAWGTMRATDGPRRELLYLPRARASALRSLSRPLCMGNPSRRRKAWVKNCEKANAARWAVAKAEAAAELGRASAKAASAAAKARKASLRASAAEAVRRQLRGAAGELGARGQARRALRAAAEAAAEAEAERAAALEEEAAADEDERFRAAERVEEVRRAALCSLEVPLSASPEPRALSPIPAYWEQFERTPSPPPLPDTWPAAALLPPAWPCAVSLQRRNPARVGRFATPAVAQRLLQGIDLFSGMGGFARGTKGNVSCTRMYCECTEHAKKMLRRAMAAGLIDTAPIHDDIRTLAALPAFRTLCRSIRRSGEGLMFTAGWPCQGACIRMLVAHSLLV